MSRGSSDRGRGEPADFAGLLRRATEDRGVTLGWLRDRLADRGNPVSVATLSSWRSGRRRPEGLNSRVVVEELEALLELPAGVLTDRLPRSSRVGPVSPGAWQESKNYNLAEIEETMDALGRHLCNRVKDRSVQVTVDVDRAGDLRQVVTRALLQAQTAGVDELLWLCSTDRPADQQPRFHVRHGGAVSRTYVHPAQRVFGAVIKLDRTLSAGETAVIEIEEELPPGFAPDPMYHYALPRRLQELVIWVRFDPAAKPCSYQEFTVVDGAEEIIEFNDFAGDGCHLVRRSFGPGEAGLRWRF